MRSVDSVVNLLDSEGAMTTVSFEYIAHDAWSNDSGRSTGSYTEPVVPDAQKFYRTNMQPQYREDRNRELTSI